MHLFFNIIEKLLKENGFKFGSDNDFYILEKGRINQKTAILYNPNHIGRGIFMDMSKIDDGVIELSYNIPTTKSEIIGFIKVVKSIENQLKKIEMYCYEEECNYTVSKLIDNVDRMMAFNLSKLNEFCGNKDYSSYIFTLAMWPIMLDEDEVNLFAKCDDLHEFEILIHNKQTLDIYYAKPSIMTKDKNI